MNFAEAEKIAAAVLYEGYILYPYRATAIKNVQRWNFGTLYPRAWAEAQRPPEPFRLQAECLVRTAGVGRLDVRARFLHLVRKHTLQSKDWDEGVDRSCDVQAATLQDLAAAPLHHDFVSSGVDTAINGLPAEHSAPKSIFGRLTIEATLLQPELYRLSVQLWNLTPMTGAAECPREQAMLQALVSAHVLLALKEASSSPSSTRRMSFAMPPRPATTWEYSRY